MSYLSSATLPAISHVRVGSVVQTNIARFFHKHGRRKPGRGPQPCDILHNMFDCAIEWGHRPEAAGNSCEGIVRYCRRPRGRLLSVDDPAKLGAVLRQREHQSSVCVAAVFLLPLIGRRPWEIRSLCWCEVKSDSLTPIHVKTGPRHVLLVEAARDLPASLADTASGEWVLPGKGGDEQLTKDNLYSFWLNARNTTGIVDKCAAAQPATFATLLALSHERRAPVRRWAASDPRAGVNDEPPRPSPRRHAEPSFGACSNGSSHQVGIHGQSVAWIAVPPAKLTL